MPVWLRKLVFWLSTLCLGCWKAQQSLTSAREECNKCDLTAAPCFWLGISSLSTRLQCPRFSCFVSEVGKKCITKLGCEKRFRSVSHVEYLWRCCKRSEILKNQCETIETCCFEGWGEGEEGKKLVGGDEKWLQIIGSFQGSFKRLVTTILRKASLEALRVVTSVGWFWIWIWV